MLLPVQEPARCSSGSFGRLHCRFEPSSSNHQEPRNHERDLCLLERFASARTKPGVALCPLTSTVYLRNRNDFQPCYSWNVKKYEMNSVVQFLENIHQHMSPWQMSCFSCSIKSYRKKTSTWLDCTTTCCFPSQNFWSMVSGCHRAEVIWFYGSSDLCWILFVERLPIVGKLCAIDVFAFVPHLGIPTMAEAVTCNIIKLNFHLRSFGSRSLRWLHKENPRILKADTFRL